MWIAAALLFFFQAAGPSADGLKALEEHRYEAAVESFRKAIDADPADYAAHFNLAVAYGFLNQDAAGIAEYRKTLELKPGLFEAETNAGLLLLRQKRPAEALPLFEDASRQKPQDFAVALPPGPVPIGYRRRGEGGRELSRGARDQSQIGRR